MRPRQVADYTAFLTNDSGHVITLVSGTLIATHGYATPRLRGLAVEPGKDFVAVGKNWPTPNDVTGKLIPFKNYELKNGQRAQILYGVYSRRLGDFLDAGVKVSVRDPNGHSHTVLVYGNASTCVTHRAAPCPEAFNRRATQTVSKQ